MLKSSDVTIIFYTSNHEEENFEKNIRRVLLTTIGDLPLISVSQKPIDFGENICVGEVGANDHNLYRQIQIACQSAKTPFVASAEADNLYPPDYINFNPPVVDAIYRYNNIWVLKHWQKVFVRKSWCEGAQIIGREYYLSLLEKEFEDLPMWTTKTGTKTNPFKRLNRNWTYYGTKNPVVSFKTGHGLRSNTLTLEESAESLPYWGSVSTVRRKLKR